VSDPEHTLDQIAERSKGLLRSYGISHEIERPGGWECYRQCPEAAPRWARRFNLHVDLDHGDFIVADVFMYYPPRGAPVFPDIEGTESGAVEIWSLAQLFLPGRPACASSDQTEIVPLTIVIEEGIGAIVLERLRRRLQTIEVAIGYDLRPRPSVLELPARSPRGG
jgi:hypothetical protein